MLLGIPPLFRRPALQALGLFLLAVVFFLPAVGAGFVWDDVVVHAAPELETVSGLKRIWLDSGLERHTEHYWPILHTSFWLEYQLWGDHPAGYHAVNILLHAINCLLILRLLRRLEVPGAWAAAAVFAVHPVHVESVAWVIERKDVLSALFYFLSVLAFLRFADGRRIAPWLLSLLLFTCAMFSKSVAISLPVALALILWWKQGRLERRDLLALAPFVVFAAGLEFITGTLMAQETRGMHELQIPLLARPIIAGLALWFYIGKLLFPYPLLTIYPRWEIDPASFLQWLAPVSVAMVLVLLWLMRRRWGRGPLVAALFFCVTLGPMLGFIPFGQMRFSFVADRFQYIASLGPIAAAAAGATLLLTRHRRWLPYAAAAFPLLLLVYGALSWKQSERYESMTSLFGYTLAHNDKSWMAWLNYGVGLGATGDYEQALDAFNQALEINPKVARAHRNTGHILLRQGRAAAALEPLKRSVELETDNAQGFFFLGQALMELDHPERAAIGFRRAVELKPEVAEYMSSLAFALWKSGDRSEAVDYFRKAMTVDPRASQPWTDYGVLLLAEGRFDEAIAHFHEALERDPASAKARLNLGVALARLGEFADAERQLTRAAELDPSLAEVYVNLAGIYAQRGETDRALAALDEAVRRRPGLAAQLEPLRRRLTARPG